MSFLCILLIIQLINTMRILTVMTVMTVEVKGEKKYILKIYFGVLDVKPTSHDTSPLRTVLPFVNSN